MGIGLEAANDPAVVGFDAGWKVELRKSNKAGEPVDSEVITLSRQRYFAQIKVNRQASLTAPTFEVIVDGLSDKVYRDAVGGPYLFAKVMLGWRDLGSGAAAPFGDLGAMLTGGKEGTYVEVIHGRITAVERLPGQFRYRTRFAGVDYRFHKLCCTTARKPQLEPGATAGQYAEALCGQAGVPIVLHPRSQPGEPIDERIEIKEDVKVTDALRVVASKAHGDEPNRQIPMFLRTDGLHFGPWTSPVMLDPPQGETKTLDLQHGLVETKPLVQPNPDECDLNPFVAPPLLGYEITLRGRADISVGDRVQVDVDEPIPGQLQPTTSESILGGLGDIVADFAEMFGATAEVNYSDRQFRVTAVRHELDRSKGFVTTLKVEREDDNPASSGTEPAKAEQARALDEAARTAILLAANAREARRAVAVLDIGQVNKQWVEPGSDAGHAVAAQRIDVQEGLDADGAGNTTVRAARRETPTQLFNKPYLTPFAFGSAGLVVPHYPGMRVVDLHYREQVAQTIVAGCLWNDGAEPQSQLGDWWLSLPTQVTTTEAIDDSRQATAPVGPASHDLIALDGTRAVHLRGLRISVGQGKLPDVGTRPDNAPVDEVLIEHKSGAKVRIDADGNITLEAASGKDMTLKANKITLDVADSVEVV
jgi:hypothetical protein